MTTGQDRLDLARIDAAALGIARGSTFLERHDGLSPNLRGAVVADVQASA